MMGRPKVENSRCSPQLDRDEGSQRGARDGRACVVEIDPDRICSDPVAFFLIGAIGSSTFLPAHDTASDPSVAGVARSGLLRSEWAGPRRRQARSRDAPENGERLASGASDRICTDRIWNSSTSWTLDRIGDLLPTKKRIQSEHFAVDLKTAQGKE
jgi:hypothetical protein